MTILMPRLIADRIVDWRINSTHEQASQIYDVTPLQQLCLQHGGGNCSQQQDAAVTPRIECWQNVGNAHAQIAMQQNAKKSNFTTFSSHTHTHTHTHTGKQAKVQSKTMRVQNVKRLQRMRRHVTKHTIATVHTHSTPDYHIDTSPRIKPCELGTVRITKRSRLQAELRDTTCDNYNRKYYRRCNNIVSYEFLWIRRTRNYI